MNRTISLVIFFGCIANVLCASDTDFLESQFWDQVCIEKAQGVKEQVPEESVDPDSETGETDYGP